MSEDDIRDNGTVVCQVHGLRYDPSVSTGCIRCPHKSAPAPSRKKSSVAPSASPPSEAPPRSGLGGAAQAGLPARRSWMPPGPGSQPPGDQRPSRIAPPGASTAHIPPPSTIYVSRRTFMIVGGLAIAGAAYAVNRTLTSTAQDVADRITPFTYENGSKPSTGTIFVPSSAAQGPRPLLVLFDPESRSKNSVARFAMLAEQHGWVVASSNNFTKGVNAADADEMLAMIAHVKANYPVDEGRAFVGGYDSGASNAYRLALVKPDVIAGAIVEFGDDDVWRELGGIASGDLSFYLFSRTSDVSVAAMHVLRDEMPRRGFKVVYVEELGAHTLMVGPELAAVMDWLDAVRGT